MAATRAVSRPRTRPFQRLIARAARLLARGVYRSVEVENTAPGWSRHPVIIVANHPTGFSDPALLLGLLERSPRFLAKSTLWKTPGLGWFLDRIGAIPVFRHRDGSTARNHEMFEAAYEVLRDGDTVALFPEGKAIDSPSVAPIKTGAARIALGARTAGVGGVHIVPVGIHFEDKAAVRSRAYIRVGSVLDLDVELPAFSQGRDGTVEDRETVHRLTAEIERRLRASAPNHASRRAAGALSFASAVALRERGTAHVAYADRERVAAMLARENSDVQAGIISTAEDYRSLLEEAGVRDADVMRTFGSSRLRHRLVWMLAFLVLLAPFALAGVILNLAPYLALRAGMRLQHSEMTPSTIRLLAAAVSFLVMWMTWAVVAASLWDWRMAVIAFMAGPMYGAAAVFVLDMAVGWWRDRSGYRRASQLVQEEETVLPRRGSLVSAVEQALAS